jgi:ACS family hexuronate transporter-like MFS transporter
MSLGMQLDEKSSAVGPETPGASRRGRTFAESLRPAERRLRWFIVGWITLSTILNLINRNTLAILAPTFSSKFSGVSFTDAPRLAEKLRAGSDPVSQYLRGQFSAQSVRVLMDARATQAQQEVVLIDELNLALHRDSLYDPQRFAGVTLSAGTLELLSEKPQAEGGHPTLDAVLRAFQIKSRDPKGEHLVRLNRSLLHDTYPSEIARIPFEVTDMAFGIIIMAFQFSYAIMYIAGGRFVDRVGEKIGMTACIVWWSISTMLHALARGVVGLGFFRFLLGVGEPGNYPAALRASARWFSKEERGLPIAIWSSGSSVGSLLSVPLIAFLAYRFGWHMAFFVPGFLGLLWVLVWVAAYRMPSVAVDGPGRSGVIAGTPASETFIGVLKDKRVRAMIMARLLTDPIWVFYLTWTPKYLAEVWNFNLVKMGLYGWIPFLFGGLGGVLGGVISDWLIRRGLEPAQARKRVLYITGAIAPLGMLTGFVGAAGVSIALIAMMAFVCYVWFINTAALMSDVFSERIVGTVLGLAAGIGQFGGLLMALLAGALLEKSHSYTALFVVAGSGHLLAALILFLFLKDKPATEIS